MPDAALLGSVKTPTGRAVAAPPVWTPPVWTAWTSKFDLCG